MSEEDKKITFKTDEEIKEISATLNEGQLVAFNGLLEFLRDDTKRFATVAGYAGTGKTYMISRLLSSCYAKKAATAPTNKAVKVLRESGSLQGVDYSTIHQLLALKLEWKYPPKGSKGEPEQILVEKRTWDKMKGYVEPPIKNYNILVVDEVSMLDDVLFHKINLDIYSHIKVIFMGDPAQIPPVTKNGGSPDAIPLLPDKRTEYGIQFFELTEIMRQKSDSRIITVANDVRQNRFSNGNTIKHRTTKGDTYFYSSGWDIDKAKFGKTMLDMFVSDGFKEDPNYCKVLAWTNKTVDAFNNLIRKKIFGTENLLPIMSGEKLIADKPITETILSDSGDEMTNIIFNTSDEFEVLRYDVSSVKFKGAKKKDDKSNPTPVQLDLIGDDLVIDSASNEVHIIYYDCYVSYKPYDSDEYCYKSIKVMKEESSKAFSWLLSTYRQAEDWKGYTKLIEYFAKVKYNYSITCHKSQGSTYKNVFVIEDDIDKNYKYVERNRIKYTAITRASKQLHILSHNNPRDINVHQEDAPLKRS